MPVQTIVRNGKVVIPDDGVYEYDILIENGKIAGLLAPDATKSLDAKEVIDSRGATILPGLIDPHVHVGLYHKPEEDFYPASTAAAAGGITTMMDFFFDTRSSHETVPQRLKLMEKQSIVDYALHLGVLNQVHLAELEEYVREYRVTSFKYPMHWKGAEKTRANSDYPLDDGFLYRILRKTGKLNERVVIAVHCQNVEITYPPFAKSPEHYLLEGTHPKNNLEKWEILNPGIGESEAVLKVLHVAELTKAPVYLVHLSAKETVSAMRYFDLAAMDSYGETCPHYLALTTDSEADLLAKINPPVRYKEDIDALWDALSDGTLSTVGTDHLAATVKFKKGENDNKDVFSAPLGFPGMATFLPVVFTEAVKRRMSLPKLATVISTNAAKIFGLYPRKGTIQVGSDADLVFIDTEKERKVRNEDLHELSDFTVYEGMTLKGWPIRAMVRGVTVFENGEIKAHAGHGIYLPRA